MNCSEEEAARFKFRREDIYTNPGFARILSQFLNSVLDNRSVFEAKGSEDGSIVVEQHEDVFADSDDDEDERALHNLPGFSLAPERPSMPPGCHEYLASVSKPDVCG